MTKKYFLKTTIAFIIIATIMFIASILPFQNSKVLGMLFVLTLFIMFIQDYNVKTKKDILKLIPITGISLIASYIASLNIVLGFIVSLIWLSALIYLSLHNFKTEVYLPLTFIYLVTLLYSKGATNIIFSFLVIISGLLIGLLVMSIANKITNKTFKAPILNNVKITKFNFNTVSFSVKLSLLISIVYFGLAALKLNQESWLLFGVIGITYPYELVTNSESTKNLLLGNLFGAIRILIVLSLAPIYGVRMGVMGMGFYIFMSSKKPRSKAMGGMMFALGMTETLSTFSLATFKTSGFDINMLIHRAVFIIVAFIVAVIFTKLTSLYKNKNLIQAY